MSAPRPVVSLIVARSRNGVIGRNGRLPWRIPAELQRFKQLTMGHPIVMGRKTWDSIARLLPGRKTLIVTRNRDLQVEGALTATSLQEALQMTRAEDEVFVIGGAEIFRLALPLAHRLYLTTVDIECEGDTFMPPVDWSQWQRIGQEPHAAQEEMPGWVLESFERSPPGPQAG